MSDRTAIEAFTQGFEPYSDFHFSTLFFYNTGSNTHWCWLNGNLVLRLRDGFGPGTYLTFLGVQKPADTATALIDYATQMNYTPTLCRVPDVTAQAIERETDRISVIEDRNGFDYVYRVEPLTRLEGHTFKAVRNKIRHVSQCHPTQRLAQLDLSCPTELQRVRSTVAAWWPPEQRTATLEAYCSALGKCLFHASAFNLVALGLIADGALYGFHIAEPIRGSWFMAHFAASDPHRRGTSTFLVHQMAHHALKLDTQHLNYQEDMGLPGLRKYKTEWSPCSFLRKFSISPVKDSASC